jgi:hypothetical protein
VQIRINRVVAIEQAKKLLGDEALSMTDEEIQDLIDDFDMIAQFSIKMVQEFKTGENKQIK